MYGYIYKTTNLINGKIYIGQHKHTEFDTKYIGSGTMLFRAINKSNKTNKIKIKCVETNEIFNSISDARKYLGLHSNSSLYAALYENKKCRGFHWIVIN